MQAYRAESSRNGQAISPFPSRAHRETSVEESYFSEIEAVLRAPGSVSKRAARRRRVLRGLAPIAYVFIGALFFVLPSPIGSDGVADHAPAVRTPSAQVSHPAAQPSLAESEAPKAIAEGRSAAEREHANSAKKHRVKRSGKTGAR